MASALQLSRGPLRLGFTHTLHAAHFASPDSRRWKWRAIVGGPSGTDFDSRVRPTDEKCLRLEDSRRTSPRLAQTAREKWGTRPGAQKSSVFTQRSAHLGTTRRYFLSPSGAGVFVLSDPRLALWAAFLRRFAAFTMNSLASAGLLWVVSVGPISIHVFASHTKNVCAWKIPGKHPHFSRK